LEEISGGQEEIIIYAAGTESEKESSLGRGEERQVLVHHRVAKALAQKPVKNVRTGRLGESFDHLDAAPPMDRLRQCVEIVVRVGLAVL
jgi:hypothetical protein